MGFKHIMSPPAWAAGVGDAERRASSEQRQQHHAARRRQQHAPAPRQQRQQPRAVRRRGAHALRRALAALALLAGLAASAAPRAAAAPGSVPVQYCPDGRSLETGLCYKRCPLGSVGAGCSCWRDGRSAWRGCGVRPRTCAARSFRPAALPPVPAGERGAPFTLVLSSDPQLFRNYTRYDDRGGAEAINRRLVTAINNVTGLGAWPPDAGGGPVGEPRSLVVLGDLTEFYMERQLDGFRHFYDPSFPRAEGDGGADRVRFPTWLMLGNHDYVNNVRRCSEKAVDASFCAKWAVAMMRAALSPDCPSSHWAGLPKANITSLDIGSMSYSFDYGRYHFVVLQHSPRYEAKELGIVPSMAWLARELAAATAAQRRVVLLLHAHKELRLTHDPSFARLLENSNVVAMFYGHVHIRPWGLVGRYPNTSVPMYNCGASWYNVYCVAEFGDDALRVGAVAHYGDGVPTWFGTSLHTLPRGQRSKPVLEVFVPNPNVTTWRPPPAANLSAAPGADAVSGDGGAGRAVTAPPAGHAPGGGSGGGYQIQKQRRLLGGGGGVGGGSGAWPWRLLWRR
ncbi:MAG: Metallo-dependent phosphatase-like protein [Monoraphidium minutum]|nr:MAG: Metallo-dependent phosphatase-like protein [Monoraphidium minutum]